MLGPFSLLPLLKGWENRKRTYERTVQRGQTLELARISELGWLVSIVFLTDDCHCGLRISWQGADLDLKEVGVFPEAAKVFGLWQQDPGGYLGYYYRPNPASTAGSYQMHVFKAGYSGSPLPYVPTVVVQAQLLDSSTQPSALIQASYTAIAITDSRLFMRSLRSVLGMPVILPIDPALLVPGRQELTLKGPQEKETEK